MTNTAAVTQLSNSALAPVEDDGKSQRIYMVVWMAEPVDRLKSR